ncbi:hypothetical protein JCM9140_2971 [Halalkalibacter wakoensis JCM 9140]|uniref:Sporulation protein YjcZ n=1 Tax=Halalkalibacter wakoensis JCM 9140 TaxID=1236970 RepID=W4Q456_9BACI|nr:YjcZ family sporulation protein [Halalkalibacter wakoensis]GAE26866.1 hypothetical protein JCM9140_2971 [Halalkalibacter wakoensis JCM 9140]
MYDNLHSPHTMMAGANVPANIPHTMAVDNMPPMVAGAMDMPYYSAPAYGYGYGYTAPKHGGSGFTLIVVLFILLIIVGATFIPC